MAPVEGGGDSAASRDEPTPSGGGRHPESPPDLAASLPLRFAEVDLGRVRIGLVALADPDVLLDALTQEEFDRSDGRMPYWAVLWPSALALAKVVLAGASPAGRRVLDLGCGLGLTGICHLWDGGFESPFGSVGPNSADTSGSRAEDQADRKSAFRRSDGSARRSADIHV